MSRQDLESVNEGGPMDFDFAASNAGETVRSALDVQVGGGHYKTLAIQPIEFIIKNNLGFCEGNVIKYITRYRLKGGTEDLEKARHYIDLLLEQRKGIK